MNCLTISIPNSQLAEFNSGYRKLTTEEIKFVGGGEDGCGANAMGDCTNGGLGVGGNVNDAQGCMRSDYTGLTANQVATAITGIGAAIGVAGIGTPYGWAGAAIGGFGTALGGAGRNAAE